MTGAQLWSNPDSFAFPAAVLEGGNVQYGSLFGSSTVYAPNGSVVASDQPAFLGQDGAGNLWLAPLVVRGTEQVGSLLDGSFGAVVTTEAYLDPLSAFPTVLGGPQKTSAQPVCTPPLWNTPPRDYSLPRTFRYVFSDAFTPAVTNPAYSAEEKALFVPAFEKWKFDGDRGYTGAFEPWVPTQPGSPNLFLGKGVMSRFDYAYPPGGAIIETRVFLPYTEFPGSTSHPKATYGQTESDVRAALMSRRTQQWGTDPLLPDDMFGLYTHKDLPTLTETDKAYFTYVLLHESGHLIGLRHVQAGCSPSTSVMSHTFWKDRHKAPAAPTEEDKKAVRKLLGIPQ